MLVQYHKTVDPNKEPSSLVAPLLHNGNFRIYFLQHQILKILSHLLAKRFHDMLANISSAFNCWKNKNFPLKSKVEFRFLKLPWFIGDDRLI